MAESKDDSVIKLKIEPTEEPYDEECYQFYQKERAEFMAKLAEFQEKPREFYAQCVESFGVEQLCKCLSDNSEGVVSLNGYIAFADKTLEEMKQIEQLYQRPSKPFSAPIKQVIQMKVNCVIKSAN